MSKTIPDFESEEQEKRFWKTHDIREYINWDNAKPFVDRVFKNSKNSEAILKDLKKQGK
ncbi:MAG: hypothetical protein GY786_11995 [Proteobacteria bacterium]|nr:hypothetical protein [Pseudomonadota bacterium]